VKIVSFFVLFSITKTAFWLRFFLTTECHHEQNFAFLKKLPKTKNTFKKEQTNFTYFYGKLYTFTHIKTHINSGIFTKKFKIKSKTLLTIF